MAQKHNPEYIDAPMTRFGTIQGPEEDKRVVRTSAFVAAKWASENPILQLGEIGYETDTHLLKVGDGTTAYNSLAYAGDGSLPTQTGNSGKFLTTDGTSASWATLPSIIDDNSTASDKTWSASKLNTTIGDIETLLAAI